MENRQLEEISLYNGTPDHKIEKSGSAHFLDTVIIHHHGKVLLAGQVLVDEAYLKQLAGHIPNLLLQSFWTFLLIGS